MGGERVAAIDCGTNTIKLLIGRPPNVEVLETRMVRLGQGLDRTGRLSDEALARAFTAVEEYAGLIAARDIDAKRIRFVATSASRDARNGEVFFRGVRERLGVDPEVVSGTEEAALAYEGAVRHLRVEVARPVLVVDIGGGSTELILGSRGVDAGAVAADAAHHDEPAASYSMDVGSVRLHERHLHADPPTPDEVAATVADIDAALDACTVSPSEAASVLGVAGTACTIAAGVLDLPSYDKDRIDQARVPVPGVHAFVERLVAMTVAERRALPYMHPGRADVIDAGGLILSRVLARTGVEVLVASTSDLLHGIAWSLAAGHGR